MERVALLIETLVVQLVVGCSVFLAVALALSVFLRVRWRLRWLTVFGILNVVLLLSVLCAVAFWRLWPGSLGGPMLAYFIHLPALCASLLVVPVVSLSFRFALRPNKLFQPTP